MNDGRARCVRVVLCAADGRPVDTFEQGEAAHFHVDFAIESTMEAVSGGIEFHDSFGQVIHGRDCFQREAGCVVAAVAGTILRYHIVVDLDVAQGEYGYTLGLTAVSRDDHAAYRAGSMAYLDLTRRTTEVVRATEAGRFTVRSRADGRLSHHGIASLGGSLRVARAADGGLMARARTLLAPVLGGQVPATAPDTPPTIYHVTHWKAGSQWIKKILAACAADRIVAPQAREIQYREWPLQPGKIYPTVYVDKKEFDARRQPGPFRRFVVIRDLRDTLVSGYFSLKVSHRESDPAVPRLRAVLAGCTVEEGMVLLMDEWLPASARIQLGWLESGERLIKYEDLIERDLEILEPLLLEECALPVERERLRAIIIANRFANVTGGRAPGTEDVSAHERKGISGDWKQHFTPAVRRAFKARYGGLLVATGYERDLDW